MRDLFVEQEWTKLCERVRASATALGTRPEGNKEAFTAEADEFCNQPPPDRYPGLLARVRDAAELAKNWQSQVGESFAAAPTPHAQASAIDTPSADQHPHTEAEVDEAGDESFPASDPPAWTATTIT